MPELFDQDAQEPKVYTVHDGSVGFAGDENLLVEFAVMIREELRTQGWSYYVIGPGNATQYELLFVQQEPIGLVVVLLNFRRAWKVPSGWLSWDYVQEKFDGISGGDAMVLANVLNGVMGNI